ncbi:hypothetical protein EON65_03925 [archaeon]|nr:MAG: hypothetical protein EON65_03925 [archaeon]
MATVYVHTRIPIGVLVGHLGDTESLNTDTDTYTHAGYTHTHIHKYTHTHTHTKATYVHAIYRLYTYCNIGI